MPCISYIEAVIEHPHILPDHSQMEISKVQQEAMSCEARYVILTTMNAGRQDRGHQLQLCKDSMEVERQVCPFGNLSFRMSKLYQWVGRWAQDCLQHDSRQSLRTNSRCRWLSAESPESNNDVMLVPLFSFGGVAVDVTLSCVYNSTLRKAIHKDSLIQQIHSTQIKIIAQIFQKTLGIALHIHWLQLVCLFQQLIHWILTIKQQLLFVERRRTICQLKLFHELLAKLDTFECFTVHRDARKTCFELICQFHLNFSCVFNQASSIVLHVPSHVNVQNYLFGHLITFRILHHWRQTPSYKIFDYEKFFFQIRFVLEIYLISSYYVERCLTFGKMLAFNTGCFVFLNVLKSHLGDLLMMTVKPFYFTLSEFITLSIQSKLSNVYTFLQFSPLQIFTINLLKSTINQRFILIIAGQNLTQLMNQITHFLKRLLTSPQNKVYEL